MIHIIYCYFIVNAFLAGITLGDRLVRWWVTPLTLLFGTFISLYHFLTLGLLALDKALEIRFLFFVTFTDRYRAWAEELEYRQMLRNWYGELNAYKRWVIRLWAKKYGVKL